MKVAYNLTLIIGNNHKSILPIHNSSTLREKWVTKNQSNIYHTNTATV